MRFLLPDAVFDQHIVLLGKTRSGKSSVMRLFVEYLLDKGEPVCVIDPKGDHWGLKSSATGKSAGYPVVIFGGEHADVPLNARSGAAVAELVCTGNRSCIIDLGGWMPGERTQFWIDFASTYFRFHRGRHWLAIDEVHNFCPKGKIMDPNAGKMLHWSNRLASEGLGKGISMIAASQRPQKVHNDFLTSCETLIAMRVIHKADRDAISDWIDGCADPAKAGEVLRSVAQMKRGEGWTWSPEAEFGPKRIQFPMFATYDSFKPQKAHVPARLKGWAGVDLGEVTKKLEAVVKEAEAKDPEKLKARIRELERSLKQSDMVAVGKTAATAIVHVSEEFKATKLKVKELKAALEEAMRVLVKITATGFENTAIKPEEIQKALEDTAKEISHIAKDGLKRRSEEFEKIKREANRTLLNMKRLLEKENLNVAVSVRHNEPVTIRPEIPRENRPEVPFIEGGELSKPQQAIIRALAEFAAIGRTIVPRPWVAALAGASHRSSAYANNVSRLKTIGWIEYESGSLKLTADGKSKAPAVDPPESSEAMLARCLSIVSRPQGEILKAVCAVYPNTLDRPTTGERAGASPTSSAFANNVSALKSAGMIEYVSGGLKAADWLFLD